jgi:hypothetical protein
LVLSKWIGLRENLQETRVIFPLNMGFPVKVPLNQSIDFTMGNPQAMAMAQQS